MEINTSKTDSALTVELDGCLDTLTAPELKETLENSLEGIDSLIIDFSKVEYISSAGLRVLLNAHKQMSERKGMKVINANSNVLEVLDITGFGNILTVERA